MSLLCEIILEQRRYVDSAIFNIGIPSLGLRVSIFNLRKVARRQKKKRERKSKDQKALSLYFFFSDLIDCVTQPYLSHKRIQEM